MDYSGSRKAYIVFSIIFPQGTAPSDDVLELLGRFKNYYKVESNGLPSQEIFYRKLAEYNAKASTGSNSSLGTQVGYVNYASVNEIKNVFADLDILDYQRVYFFDRPNSYVLSNPNFVAVASLERKYAVDIINYNPYDFQITINGYPALNENLLIQGLSAKLINLKRYDKIEIKRGGSQPVTSFNANEKNRVELPKPQPATPKEITFRNLDPSNHEVRINGVIINTTKTENGVFIFPISTQNVKVEIIDRNTKQVIQTNDTAISKEYEVRVLTINSGGIVGTVGTTQTGQSGTGGYGGSTTTGHSGGITNSGGGAIIGDDKPRKKSKVGLIITLSSIVILAIVAIVLWKSGVFDEEVKPPTAGNTKNASANAGTENVGIDDNTEQEVKLINPEGLTVKPGKEAILTEKGLNKDGSFYRYFNGKWEVKPKTADGTKSNWQPLKDVDKTFIIALFFSINSAEQNKKIEEEKKNENNKGNSNIKNENKNSGNTTNNNSNKNNSTNPSCKSLESILADAKHFNANIEEERLKSKKDELLNRLKLLSDKDCTDCKISKESVRDFILKMTGY
jgi:hypothetical protein